MASETVWTPGRNGSPEERAAAANAAVQPGLTAKRAPARWTCSSWAGLSTVPAPTIASGTSATMARSASSAASVRKVISRTGKPPFTSARASGTAVSALSMVRTGITGATAAMAAMFTLRRSNRRRSR